MSKLSVIVPIYNSAPYLERCLCSLFEQTLDDIEYVIIDDGSTDGSATVIDAALKRYPHRAQSVIMVKHEHNMGIAYTRQEGFNLATGEYVIHCDSDDWVDQDYYQKLYNHAIAVNAEIVTGLYMLEKKDVKYVCRVPFWNNWEAMLSHPKWEFLPIWCHMIQRDFLKSNGLGFYLDINYAEDYGLLMRCYFYSTRNAFCDADCYYHYSKANVDSMTSNRYLLPNLISKQRCMQRLSDFVDAHGGEANKVKIIVDEKRAVKEGYLLAAPPDYKRWHDAFPEITPMVLMDKKLSLKCRLLWAVGQYVHPSIMRLTKWF